MNCRLWVVLRIFRLNFIIQVMNKILQSDMFTKTWMWNGRILCFVALIIAMNLSDHLCSAGASTNGEFHLHNAKRKQYSSILHSLYLGYETAIFWIYTLKKFNLKIRQSMLRAAEIKDETPGWLPERSRSFIGFHKITTDEESAWNMSVLKLQS